MFETVTWCCIDWTWIWSSAESVYLLSKINHNTPFIRIWRICHCGSGCDGYGPDAICSLVSFKIVDLFSPLHGTFMRAIRTIPPFLEHCGSCEII